MSVTSQAMKEILFTACSCSITCHKEWITKKQYIRRMADADIQPCFSWIQLWKGPTYPSFLINDFNSWYGNVHPDPLFVFALGTSSYRHSLCYRNKLYLFQFLCHMNKLSFSQWIQILFILFVMRYKPSSCSWFLPYYSLLSQCPHI